MTSAPRTWPPAGRARRWCRFFTAQWYARSNGKAPVAVVNIGGVANVTYLDGDADPIAFDTGPGNAPMDELMRSRSGKPMDEDGALAAKGKCDEARVEAALADPFFAQEAAEVARPRRFREFRSRCAAA